jgi:hypothetical protein
MKIKLSLIILLCAFVSCSHKAKEDTAKTPAPTVNDLPAMQITLLNGTKLSAKELALPAILIFFQPDCDHCQREAQQIGENLSAFKNYTLYFISSAAKANVQKFAGDYGLEQKDKVLFGVTTVSNILDNFGPIQAPSIYIYSDQGKRVQEFNGEVAIEVVLKYL